MKIADLNQLKLREVPRESQNSYESGFSVRKMAAKQVNHIQES